MATQGAMAAKPAWSSMSAAVDAALIDSADRARLLAAIGALETANEVLSGQASASRLSANLPEVLRADYDNAVTRWCVALLEADREKSAGRDVSSQFDAFSRTIRDPSIRQSSLYCREWSEGWARALTRQGLDHEIAEKPSTQAMLTYQPLVLRLWIEVLPKLVRSARELESGLVAANRPDAARAVRAFSISTLTDLLVSDGSAANTLLSADLLVRINSGASTESDKPLQDWRDRLRRAVQKGASTETDVADVSSAPVHGLIDAYQRVVRPFRRNVVLCMLVWGAALAALSSLISPTFWRNRPRAVAPEEGSGDFSVTWPGMLRRFGAGFVILCAVWIAGRIASHYSARLGSELANASYLVAAGCLLVLVAWWLVFVCPRTHLQYAVGLAIVTISLATGLLYPKLNHTGPTLESALESPSRHAILGVSLGYVLLGWTLSARLARTGPLFPVSTRAAFFAAAWASISVISLSLALATRPSHDDEKLAFQPAHAEMRLYLGDDQFRRFVSELRELSASSAASKPSL